MDVAQRSALPTFAMLLANKEDQQQFQATATGRTNRRRNISEDDTIPIRARGKTFTLRKHPLVSKSGYIRKRIAEMNHDSVYEMGDVPAGARGMELAVRFCCEGSGLEVDVDNVALLRCVGELLEMREEYAEGNLVRRAEEYLREVALKSLEESITVLRHSEGLLPAAEKVGLVGRCVDAIAKIACSDSRFYCLPLPRSTISRDGDGAIRSPLRRPLTTSQQQDKGFAGWWAENLTVLRIDTFKRVVLALKSRGFKHHALGTVLLLYAQKSLRRLDISGRGWKKMDPRTEHEKRVVLETIVSMLPKEENALSVSFLAMLLRAAVHLETTVACRLDLEKRIGMQLHQAVLDDLLIPSWFSLSGDTAFDVDSICRILVNYLEHNEDCGGTNMGYSVDDDHALSDMEKVGRLMESYLVEIATDQNLAVVKFLGLAELIPEQARITEDGMYRAIDIYLKAHPSLSDAERKKVCSVMDCQRLSREACAHAAQNGRLPVQIVIQVMYCEQQCLSDAMSDDGHLLAGGGFPSPYLNVSPDCELACLRRENNNLRQQLVKMKTQMRQIEKTDQVLPTTSGKPPLPITPEKPPIPKKSIIDSVSKKLGRLNPFHFDSMKSPSTRAHTKPPKNRRHSIS